MYDVTRRETLDSLEDVWMTEVDTFKTLEHPATMVVGNKADLVRLPARIAPLDCWWNLQAYGRLRHRHGSLP